jgi:hypothetical protein
MFDLHAHGNVTDPKKRFLLRVVEKDDTHPFARVLASQFYFAEDWPDFMNDPKWKEKLTLIPNGTVSPRGFLQSVGYDEQAGMWFYQTQDWPRNWSQREGRDIIRYETPDWVQWGQPSLVLPIQPDESKDPRDYVEYMNLDAYRVGGFATGAWLGQLLIFHSDRTNEQYRMPRPFVVWRKGTTELRLVLSRDAGRSWQRVGGKQVWLPHHPEEHGYDRLVYGQYPVRVGDELWLYDSAWNGDHLVYNRDGSFYYKSGFLRIDRTARATLRWDGYVSLDASSEEGEFLTKPLTFSGKELQVNLRAPGGQLRVELQDATSKPLPGFAAAECLPVQNDGISMPVRWRKNPSLEKLAGQTVRLRFLLKRGSLYSFRFQ